MPCFIRLVYVRTDNVRLRQVMRVYNSFCQDNLGYVKLCRINTCLVRLGQVKSV